MARGAPPALLMSFRKPWLAHAKRYREEIQAQGEVVEWLTAEVEAPGTPLGSYLAKRSPRGFDTFVLLDAGGREGKHPTEIELAEALEAGLHAVVLAGTERIDVLRSLPRVLLRRLGRAAPPPIGYFLIDVDQHEPDVVGEVVASLARDLRSPARGRLAEWVAGGECRRAKGESYQGVTWRVILGAADLDTEAGRARGLEAMSFIAKARGSRRGDLARRNITRYDTYARACENAFDLVYRLYGGDG
ncbi:MAG: hypothetical protein H6806_03185 [Planctomycetes bacterium]|nr:hypothetical protein [Planctomycetota bacterium]MCB9825305.1 hypothetical protein [Planctomycetota bacterium]MCB9828758.1 hypothetical protein [Planctomycetota bacterium]MCB9900791.1 hypothetical protein [Planctomycetota bacterium]